MRPQPGVGVRRLVGSRPSTAARAAKEPNPLVVHWTARPRVI